jgi:1-deoxy-D-xylulose-5-phosphate reductoisomerase
MRTVSLVGSTGSIGTQAVDVICAQPDDYQVIAIGAARSVDVLVAQAERLRPKQVAIADPAGARALRERLPAGIEVLAGPDAMAEIARHADVVVNGVVGFAGLPVTLAALQSGRRLALANKESLISAGPVVQRVRSNPGAEIIPVDSEHCAVHQCLRAIGATQAPQRRSAAVNGSASPMGPGGSAGPSGTAGPGGTTSGIDPAWPVRRILLTASGGPFRGRSAAELLHVTIDDALAHPTWRMGPKITIDSSTLMNKGLEVIEAHELFHVSYDRIDVVVHPQSIIHSMVETTDGATLAQLSLPDMRLPIGYALAFPDRLATPFGSIDWKTLTRLDFEQPDREAFPCLNLAYAAGRAGGTAPATLNGANEVAVAAFLKGQIRWIDICGVIDEVLANHDVRIPETVDDVLDADADARRQASGAIGRLCGATTV